MNSWKLYLFPQGQNPLYNNPHHTTKQYQSHLKK